MQGQVGLVSLTIPVGALLFSGYGTWIINHQTVQVLALSLGSITAVAVSAAILICIPDLINGSYPSRRRGRTRRRNNHKNKTNSSQSQRSKEGSNQSDYQSTSTTQSQPCNSFANSSRKKTPSLPPLSTQNRNTRVVNSKSTTSLHLVSGKQAHRTPPARRYSSPPCLLQKENSQRSLNPIVERKLEDMMAYDDFYWVELDSRTQYFALILGYTPATWDEDLDLDDLVCEDWDWDEMTKEQKAAAQHFGYTEDTWDDG
mmetsp:Transcript_15874/g.32821  ORF Transcript_15874/g.32821 Transcript_15874/m.32821 type:complete len:258 (+) Transcript_15874:171-944(+)